MKDVEREVRQALFALQDTEYRDFHSALMPTIDKEKVIGVRTPALRSFAREYGKNKEAAALYLQCLPHQYYEENNVHACLIEQEKDYDTCVSLVEAFLPYIDNWATCDMFSPKVFKKHLPELLLKVKEWIASGRTYTIRYGIGMLMKWYLDEAFDTVYLQMVAEVHSEEYYVNMMRAWYFATALAKQYDAVVPYLEKHLLDEWTHQKTIQKAIESYRISTEQKNYLRTLKIKK